MSSRMILSNTGQQIRFGNSGNRVYRGNGTEIGLSELGAGPNSPGYVDTYTASNFDNPVPISPAAAGLGGMRGFQGFSTAYNPTRVSYPTATTLIGTRPVLTITYPGLPSTSLTAVEQTTTSWILDQVASFRIQGTWSGTISFESSDNGGANWDALTCTGLGEGAVTGTSTTGNGYWRAPTTTDRLFRVRMSSYTSGTATVNVGMEGGEAAARFNTAPLWVNSPSKFYARALVYISPDWNNGGNTGTKWFFFQQDQGNNHYVNLAGDTQTPGFGLQGGTGNRNFGGTVGTMAYGAWLDIEIKCVANTPGTDNGIFTMWIDGVQVINATDVGYFGTGDTPVWTSLWCDPTFGGGLRPPANDNTYWQLAAMYVESEA